MPKKKKPTEPAHINDSAANPPPPAPLPTSLLAISQYQSDLFWRGLRRSAGAHAALAIAIVILSLAAPRKVVNFIPSIRVDLVGLPDIKKSDIDKVSPDNLTELDDKLDAASKGAKRALEEARKRPKEKPEPEPKDDTMVLKKEKPRTKQDDIKSALDRIKALSALEADDKPTQKKKVVTKGNMVSKGSSLTGAPVDNASSYVSSLQMKLRSNWNLPIWLSKQELNAKVVIFLDRMGYVNNAILAKSSGNKQFDDQCLKTVRMSQPFGAPPTEFQDAGLTLGFPL